MTHAHDAIRSWHLDENAAVTDLEDGVQIVRLVTRWV